MEREIKFRKAHFDSNDNFMCYTFWGLINHKGENDNRCFSSPSFASSASRYEDEQYTGLKDLNGNEIYEGDILDNDWVISFKDGMFGIFDDNTHMGINSYMSKHRIVIGNIHENKDIS